MFLFLLAGSNILSGCNTEDWMDEKDKQPIICLSIFEAPVTDLTGGVPSFTQKYGVRVEWWIDPISLEEYSRIVPLYPLSISRFELTIESYNINQEFDVLVAFPSVDFAAYNVRYSGNFEDEPAHYTSSSGRGPGGWKLGTVAMWAPRIGQWPRYSWEYPEADYTLSVIVTDSHGRNGYAGVGFTVQAVVLEVVEIDPPMYY